MRRDMPQVVTERPRAGGGRHRYKKRPNKNDILATAELDEEDDENAPAVAVKDPIVEKKEGIRKPYSSRGDRKVFTDHIEPLKRFLRSNTGRPWDKVYSEVCEQLKGTSTQLQHIKDHVHQYVARDVYKDDKGVLWGHHGNKSSHQPVINYRGDAFYVDDKGILRAAKPREKKESIGRRPPGQWHWDFLVKTARECGAPLEYRNNKLYAGDKEATALHAEEHIDKLFPKATSFPEHARETKYGDYVIKSMNIAHGTPFVHQWSSIQKRMKKLKHPYFIRLKQLIDERFDETLKEHKRVNKGS